jgi:transcriptional regulator GlxA family with amidase domain
MSESRPRYRVDVLALPEVTASTLFGVYDLLAGAGRDWNFIVNGTLGEGAFATRTVTADGRSFRASNGVRIEPDAALEDATPPDLICIPDMFVAPGESIEGRYAAEMEWIRLCYERGSILATACSGSLLLAEAGLLDGLDATIHWGYCDAMAQRYPKIRVQPARALVVTGEAQRIVMAGGGSSWQDMTLYLIARLLGLEEAMRTARVFLIDWHHIGQQPFAVLSCVRQVEDLTIARCQEWVAQHYHHEAPVSAMANLSGLAERSFKRRFRNATGMPPMEYVQTVRLEEAKHMLETTDLPIEAVAQEVGYGDSSFFTRLFRRNVGLTPAQYRKRFGGLRQALKTEIGVAAGAASRR